jgi:hypothetical protein
MSNIVYELGYVRTLSCIRCGHVRVVFESDSNSLGLLYNKGAPHVVTYDDLIVIGPQGSRRLVPVPRRPDYCDIRGEERL